MVKYRAQIAERKDAEAHAGQYTVYDVTCPFCGYVCEVHAVGEMGVKDIYSRCHVCKKKFWGEE